MKRLALLLVFVSLATACTGMGQTGRRGPQIGRTTVEQPTTPDVASQRELDLGQR